MQQTFALSKTIDEIVLWLAVSICLFFFHALLNTVLAALSSSGKKEDGLQT